MALNFYFIIDHESPQRIDWKNFDLPSNVRLILIAEKSCINLLEIRNDPECLNKTFEHIEPFEYAHYFEDEANSLFGFNKNLFNSLVFAIEKLKKTYVKNEDNFYITSISEYGILYCAKLREFFNIEGSKTEDVYRFLNKDIMKKHLLNKGVSSQFFPQYVKFDPDVFIEDQDKYTKKIIEDIKLPAFIKPILGAGSLGICKIESKEALKEWCNTHHNDVNQYEIEEYIEGDLYHCASIILNNEIVISFVSKYLNPCGEAFLNGKLLGSIILDQESDIALKIKNFNNVIINAMKPIENCVTHHEIFCSKNENLVFLEITNRVISGGHVAELFYDQFNLNLREIDCKLRLSLTPNLTPKFPETYHALIASISRKNQIVKNIFMPNIKSYFEFINMPKKMWDHNNILQDLDITHNDVEIKLSNRNFNELLDDFDSLKEFIICAHDTHENKIS